MKKDDVTARNLIIGAEFDKFIIEHPEFLSKIPNGAQIIFLPEYDEELYKENIKLAESLGKQDKPVVYIRLKKLKAQKSRIKHLTIEFAKAG